MSLKYTSPRLRIGNSFLAFLLAATSALGALAVGAARADDGGRYTVVEENDYFFFPTDHWYTQGGRLSYLTGEIKDDGSGTSGNREVQAFDWLDANLFASSPLSSRRVDWSIGQSIFTPTDLVAPVPDSHDRPYAGWLYMQGGVVQSTQPAANDSSYRSRLDDLELQLGVVGPSALGEETQNDFHEFALHEATSQGWSYQLHDEPGLDLTYQRRWRFGIGDDIDPSGIMPDLEIVPDYGAALGNVLTYANGGAMLRAGYDLGADYGPPRVLPASSGGDWFDQSMHDWGGYVFAQVEGQAVARNIFLDGNTFESSAHVDKVPLVGDFTYGASIYWGPWLRATVSLENRSREFYGQTQADRFTSLSLSANFDW